MDGVEGKWTRLADIALGKNDISVGWVGGNDYVMCVPDVVLAEEKLKGNHAPATRVLERADGRSVSFYSIPADQALSADQRRERGEGGFPLPRRATDMPFARKHLNSWMPEKPVILDPIEWKPERPVVLFSDDGQPAGEVRGPDLVEEVQTLFPFLDEDTRCFWVTSPMVSLLSAAAERLPDGACMTPPCHHGFVVFESPICPDASIAIRLRGFVWVASNASILLSHERACDEDGYWVETASTCIPMANHQTRSVPTGDSGLVPFYRIVTSCLTLMQQRIAITSPVAPDRAARRRLARAGLPPDPDVQVIDLRRPIERDRHVDPHSPVEWSHRWIVDGHWRNQWHPAERKHHPVWIAPHVKGPEDKPLVVHDRVYRWSK